MRARKTKGEYITDDGKLEITLSEYEKRTTNSMNKAFAFWLLITFICMSILAL